MDWCGTSAAGFRISLNTRLLEQNLQVLLEPVEIPDEGTNMRENFNSSVAHHVFVALAASDKRKAPGGRWS